MLNLSENQRLKLDHYTERYNYFEDAYEGGEDVKDKGLVKYPLEEKAEFEFRKNLQTYNNKQRRIIDGITMPIFSKPIIRNGLDDIIELIKFTNANNHEVDVNTWFKRLYTKMLVYGDVFILFDKPLTTSQSLSDFERINKDIKDSFVIIEPQNVVVLDESKNTINHIVFKFEVEQNNFGTIFQGLIVNNDTESQDDKIVIYIEYTMDAITIYNESESVLLTIPNTLKQIPVKRLIMEVNDYNYGVSLLRDTAPINYLITNIDNTISYDACSNSFERIGIPVSKEQISIMEDLYGKDKNTGRINYTTRRVYPFASGEPYTTWIKDISYIPIKLDYIAYKERQMQEMTFQRLNELVAQSGISKELDMTERNTALSFFSEMFEKMETSVWQFFFDLNSMAYSKWFIDYPSNFDILDKSKDVDNMLKIKDSMTVPEVVKAIDKVLISKYVDLPDSTVELLMGYIDKAEYVSLVSDDLTADEEALNIVDNTEIEEIADDEV